MHCLGKHNMQCPASSETWTPWTAHVKATEKEQIMSVWQKDSDVQSTHNICAQQTSTKIGKHQRELYIFSNKQIKQHPKSVVPQRKPPASNHLTLQRAILVRLWVWPKIQFFWSQKCDLESRESPWKSNVGGFGELNQSLYPGNILLTHGASCCIMLHHVAKLSLWDVEKRWFHDIGSPGQLQVSPFSTSSPNRSCHFPLWKRSSLKSVENPRDSSPYWGSLHMNTQPYTTCFYLWEYLHTKLNLYNVSCT